MNCSEYADWAAADADDVRSPGADEARRHVEGCPRCQRERAAQGAVRSLLRGRSLLEEAPPGLRTRILARLDEEQAKARRGFGLATALRFAAVGCAAAALLFGLFPGGADPFGPMIESYHQVLDGGVPLAIRTSAAGELEQFFGGHAGGVPSHVVDLEKAGFRPIGALVRTLGGKTVRLTLYSDGERLIVCDYRYAERYPGPAPETGKPLFFAKGGLTFCVTRMGREVCILATRMPMSLTVARLAGPA